MGVITPALGDYVAATTTNPGPEGTQIEPWKVVPVTAGAAPFELTQGSAQFLGVWDPVVHLGWNASLNTAGVPALRLGFEQDYADSSYGNHPVMEWYVEYVSPDHTSVGAFRPFACSVLRTDNTSHGAQIQLNMGSDGTGQILFAAGGTNWLTMLPTGGMVLASGVGGFSVGTTATADNSVSTNSVSGANGNFQFFTDGGLKYYYANFHGDTNHYLWDNVNNRFQVKYTFGASSAAALVEFQARVKIDSFGAFAAGDKYVVADASGNLHLSSLGPAS